MLEMSGLHVYLNHLEDLSYLSFLPFLPTLSVDLCFGSE